MLTTFLKAKWVLIWYYKGIPITVTSKYFHIGSCKTFRIFIFKCTLIIPAGNHWTEWGFFFGIMHTESCLRFYCVRLFVLFCFLLICLFPIRAMWSSETGLQLVWAKKIVLTLYIFIWIICWVVWPEFLYFVTDCLLCKFATIYTLFEFVAF